LEHQETSTWGHWLSITAVIGGVVASLPAEGLGLDWQGLEKLLCKPRGFAPSFIVREGLLERVQPAAINSAARSFGL
jgi:hypothetical protein